MHQYTVTILGMILYHHAVILNILYSILSYIGSTTFLIFLFFHNYNILDTFQLITESLSNLNYLSMVGLLFIRMVIRYIIVAHLLIIYETDKKSFWSYVFSYSIGILIVIIVYFFIAINYPQLGLISLGYSYILPWEQMTPDIRSLYIRFYLNQNNPYIFVSAVNERLGQRNLPSEVLIQIWSNIHNDVYNAGMAEAHLSMQNSFAARRFFHVFGSSPAGAQDYLLLRGTPRLEVEIRRLLSRGL